MPFSQGGGGLVTGSNVVDESLTNSDIAPTAGIALTKINFGSGLENDRINEGLIQKAVIDLSADDIKAGYTTPKVLIAAPGANKVIQVLDVTYEFNAGTQYTGGGAHRIRYNGDSIDLVNPGVTTYGFTNAASFVYKVVPLSSGGGTGILMTAGINKAVEWSNASSSYATGNGTAKLHITYKILSL